MELYKQELVAIARVERQRREEEKEKKEYEEKVAKMNVCGKAYVGASKAISTFLEENAHIGAKAKQELSPFWLRLVGFLANCCFVGILVGFTASSYLSDQETKYLSLDSAAQDNGSPTSNFRTCLTVPYAITKTYTMDTNGAWSGTTDYIPGHGLIVFDLNYFEKSAASYKAWMLDVKAKIAVVGAGASARNLASNLGYLMSWTYKVCQAHINFSCRQNAEFPGMIYHNQIILPTPSRSSTRLSPPAPQSRTSSPSPASLSMFLISSIRAHRLVVPRSSASSRPT